MTDPNKRFAELAGICWHEIKYQVRPDNAPNFPFTKCTCGEGFSDVEEFLIHCRKSNPDFSDAREVLKVMRDKEVLRQFLFTLAIAPYNFVKVDLVLDTTGLLRDEAIKWMKGGRDENFNSGADSCAGLFCRDVCRS